MNEERIKELEKALKHYQKQIEDNDKKLERAKKNHDNKHRLIRETMRVLEKEYDTLVVDMWIERGKQGLNHGLNTWKNEDKIPKEVKYQFAKLLMEEENGCHGDPYDGCRGCSRNCHATALEKYNKMFGF